MTEPGSSLDMDQIAAALALGFLEQGERTAARRRMLEDPEFARRVAFWQRTGDHWLEDVEPVDPPDDLLERIEARLDGFSLVDSDQAANDNANQLGFWRNWAIAATAASLLLFAGLGLSLVRPIGNGPLGPGEGSGLQAANVAQIDGADGTPLLSALYMPETGRLSLRLADLAQPGRGPELWVIPADGIPRSLGMIDESKLTITISPELRALLVDGANVAITLEPKDGRRHDAPTGAILGSGQMQEIAPQGRS